VEIIPAIDLLDGAIVRLWQGDFDRVTRYDGDPLALARAYADSGARRLHLVDLDGARSGTPGNLALLRQIAALQGIEVQIGGGIRGLAAARTLLEAGARRVVVGSVAIREPETVLAWLCELGGERVVLAFDVRCGADGAEPEAVTHGWREGSGRSLWTLLDRYAGAGASEVLCTDVGRDGTLAGPNLALYAECVRRQPGMRFIASGGLSGPADLTPLSATGVAAVVTGKALLDGRLSLEEIRQFSRAG
jgi:phosphoribosylformimino-5-aminoimidazole carboxamide ribotide isomerase